MTDIQKVEGIAYEHAKELSKAGVLTTEVLLREGATPQGRKDIEYVTRLPHKMILKWVNMVDLFNIYNFIKYSGFPIFFKIFNGVV